MRIACYTNEAHLDRRVVGSFMTMTSVMSPYLVKYSLRLSETIRESGYLSRTTSIALPEYLRRTRDSPNTLARDCDPPLAPKRRVRSHLSRVRDRAYRPARFPLFFTKTFGSRERRASDRRDTASRDENLNIPSPRHLSGEVRAKGGLEDR